MLKSRGTSGSYTGYAWLPGVSFIIQMKKRNPQYISSHLDTVKTKLKKVLIWSNHILSDIVWADEFDMIP